MGMISIKKYLKPERPKAGDYIRFLQMTLEAITLHATQTSKCEDVARFRQEASAVTEQLSDQSSVEEIEEAIGFVIRAGAGYNRIAERATDAHLQELQAMLAMMAETITYLSDSGKTGIDQLHLVEDTIKRASSVSDIRVLRSRLDDCLTLVRNESNRLRSESRVHIAKLQEGFERTASHVRSAGVTLEHAAPTLPEWSPTTLPDDPLTGLQGREAAEEMITSKISQSKEFVIAVFVVDRLGYIKGRFGSKPGDEVLMAVAQHLGERLDTGALFRWSGPAFALVMDSEDSLQVTEQKMTKIASVRIEKTLENDGRATLIAVNCSVIVQKISEADSVKDVIGNLDDFVATRM